MNGTVFLLGVLAAANALPRVSGPASPAFLLAAQAQGARPPMNHGSAPAVSPDGSKIAFLSDRDGATDIYIISADGRGESRLTNTPDVESQPGWSADGKEIRFTVFANEVSRIYSIEPTGKNQKLLGSVPGRAMRVSPD